MNPLQHAAMRGQSAIDHLSYGRQQAEALNRQFTRRSLTEWMNAAREPWRTYFPYRPDDMPPKKGDPVALAKLMQAEMGYGDAE